MKCEEGEGYKWKCYLRGAQGYLREEIVSGIKMIATEDRYRLKSSLVGIFDMSWYLLDVKKNTERSCYSESSVKEPSYKY